MQKQTNTELVDVGKKLPLKNNQVTEELKAEITKNKPNIDVNISIPYWRINSLIFGLVSIVLATIFWVGIFELHKPYASNDIINLETIVFVFFATPTVFIIHIIYFSINYNKTKYNCYKYKHHALIGIVMSFIAIASYVFYFVILFFLLSKTREKPLPLGRGWIAQVAQATK